MRERPLVFLVPEAAMAIFCSVCLDIYIKPNLSLLLLSLSLAAAGALINYEKLFTLCCMLAAAFLALTGFSAYRSIFVDPVRMLAGSHAEITATVLQDAVVYDDNQRAELSVNDNTILQRSFRMYCYLPLTETPLYAGDRIKVNVGFYLPGNLEGFDRAAYQASEGCYITASYTKNEDDTPMSFAVLQTENGSPRWIPQRIARFCKQAIEDALPEREAGLLTGLMIGNKDAISSADAISLRIAGLSHLVAVSGLHVGFLVAFCYLLFGRRLGTYLSVPLLLLFVPIAGASPSVIRAAIMYLIAAGAFITKRESDTLNSLFAALALLLMQNPYAIAGLSLQLSFAATLGLVLLAGKMQTRMLRPFHDLPKPLYRLLSFIVGAVSCTICATIFTAPILLSSFGYISILSVLSNLLVVGVTAVCFIAGFLICISSAICPAVLPVLSAITQPPLYYILWVAERISNLPFGMVSWGDGFGLAALFLCFTVILSWLIIGNRIKWKFAMPIVCLCLVILSGLSTYQYQRSYRVTYLPCGTGQAILVSDTTQATLIDCAGDGGYRDAAQMVQEWMRYHNIDHIDTLILTAVDRGHARDLPTLLQTVSVNQILIPVGSKSTKYNSDLLELCEQVDAQEISQTKTLDTGAAPITVFPVADGKMGVQIASEVLILHSPTQKQLAAFLESSSIFASEVVLSQRNMEDDELLTQALDAMGAERIIVQAGFGEVVSEYHGLSVESPYVTGEIVRQFVKE
ncbi:ComEC/Rec2 family competence protein [Candidatus Agathobaculum pullicola]|uniref:ComEC/Rec2 family competence protein n=1 Tax=Candidatus Agathobaculum pullicola TaxID=2838426 RepID=UPI003F8FE1CA